MFVYGLCLIYFRTTLVDLNSRRTGKHATKPRTLGLLGHSDVIWSTLRHYELVPIPRLAYNKTTVSQVPQSGRFRHNAYLFTFLPGFLIAAMRHII